jgi:hypothetical protein
MRRLIKRIETYPYTLHANTPFETRCTRMRFGLRFTTPDDCDRGLDGLLAEARFLISENEGSAQRAQ